MIVSNLPFGSLEDHPVIRELFNTGYMNPVSFVDSVIRECVNLNASDIFFEPRRNSLIVRARIDGVMYELGKVDLQTYDNIVARVKILSSLDPLEKKRVQEGQSTLDHEGRVVNLRVEIAQTIYGELIVIRVHEKQTIVMDIKDLGLNDEAYKSYQKMLHARSGLILVCGPTGCGKTTTLYSTISKLAENNDLNIMTIEDPVEFQLDGVNQMQTQNEKGFTFAAGLKTLLRLSPDVILVGEIRDKETAEIAVESGLTGQLVFSTIHAEDSVGALFRMLDLGIESYLLNSSLVGILSQRLVRRTCPVCAFSYTPTPDEASIFKSVTGKVPEKLTRGKGCANCNNLCYKGRTGVYELLVMNSGVRDLVRRKTNEDELRITLMDNGFTTLIRDGLSKCEEGITTVDEVVRNSLRNY